MAEPSTTQIMTEVDVRRVIERMSREVVEKNGGVEGLVVMGIHRRGTHLAAMIREEIERVEGSPVEAGSIDITLYRDDLMAIGPRPIVGGSQLPPTGVDEKNIVLVDDVLYTGRTIRAALNELTDWGRPRRIYLCVLADRGGRELPIQADIVGRTVRVNEDQRVEVLVPELDDRLGVEIIQIDTEAA